MQQDNSAVQRDYSVVVNHEEQYSIWPIGHALPAGWREAGNQGTKDECLRFIKEAWIDMRPLSVRTRLERGDVAGRIEA